MMLVLYKNIDPTTCRFHERTKTPQTQWSRSRQTTHHRKPTNEQVEQYNNRQCQVYREHEVDENQYSWIRHLFFDLSEIEIPVQATIQREHRERHRSEVRSLVADEKEESNSEAEHKDAHDSGQVLHTLQNIIRLCKPYVYLVG